MSTDTRNFFLCGGQTVKVWWSFVFAPENSHHRPLEILHWCACGANGLSGCRSIGVRSRDYQIFFHGAPLRARAPL